MHVCAFWILSAPVNYPPGLKPSAVLEIGALIREVNENRANVMVQPSFITLGSRIPQCGDANKRSLSCGCGK